MEKITQYDIDEAKTVLANIHEPNTAEEWDAFDAESFFDYFARYDDKGYKHTNEYPAIEYLCEHLPKDAKVIDAYEMLDELEEKVAEENEKRKEYLLRKQKVCTLDKEEMSELLSL